MGARHAQRRKNIGGTNNCSLHIMLFLCPDRYLFISCFFFVIFRAEIVDGDKSLVIKNVVPSDEGIYVCEAQNSVGQISSKAQLVVNCEYQNVDLPFRLLPCLFIERSVV